LGRRGRRPFRRPPITVIVGAEIHPSVTKSLGILGLGRSRVVKIPVDAQGHLRAELLPPISGPTIVIAQAGDVNTGAFDPVAAICRHAHAAGAWVHVDGAFGLWAAAAPELRHLAAGLADADSWATDAHKWLNVPYDCGLAFVRRSPRPPGPPWPSPPPTSTAGTGAQPRRLHPELSRRARGVEVWAALHSLGRTGLAALIARNCAHARGFTEKLSAAASRSSTTSSSTKSSSPSATPPHRVRHRRHPSRRHVLAGVAVWQGRTAMRISVSSWATTEADVDLSIAAILRVNAATPVAPPTDQANRLFPPPLSRPFAHFAGHPSESSSVFSGHSVDNSPVRIPSSRPFAPFAGNPPPPQRWPLRPRDLHAHIPLRRFGVSAHRLGLLQSVMRRGLIQPRQAHHQLDRERL